MPVDVVGIGMPVVDCLVSMERLPESDEQTYVHELSWQGGGKVATALAALGRLGARGEMIGVVGEDVFGRHCICDFQWNGVGVSRLVTDPGTTTDFSIVISERARQARSFISRRGTCRALCEEDLDETLLRSARYLHLSELSPTAARAARIVREAGGRVVIDADLYAADIRRNIALTDVFIASRYFYEGMFAGGSLRENCRALQKLGPEIVIVTLGAEGCAGIGREGYFELPAFTGLPVADTTGAGDVFHGAFIAGLLRGCGTMEAARFASAASAITCTRLGGRAGIPDREMLEDFLRNGSFDPAPLDERARRYAAGPFGAND